MTTSLTINLVENSFIKIMEFQDTMQVYDACKLIWEETVDSVPNLGDAKDYGLFLSDGDPKKGVWLEPSRTLNYYMLRGGDVLEYRKKLRRMKIRMLDWTVKTMMVDDSQTIANHMVTICTKIGITNHDEYSLVREKEEKENEKPHHHSSFSALALKKRKEGDKEIDLKMEHLKKKLKTEDEIQWVDHNKTLREQGIKDTETLLLKRKYFFSDRNIDERDPVQLNLLYVQCRDAIIDGTHPVTEEKAFQFAGLQCQVQLGSHDEKKHRPGLFETREFLPRSYTKLKNSEKRIFAEHMKHRGITEVEAKVQYTKLARSLPTYGVAFFLVKEKMKGKNKLVPCLLGITKESVLRLDDKTKETIKTHPLTTLKRWGVTPNTLTLDFGDYSEGCYSVRTTEGEQITQLISGYIDIILKMRKGKDHFDMDGDEGSTMVEECVSPQRATTIQHQSPQDSLHIYTNSVAKPALLRDVGGERTFDKGEMSHALLGISQVQVSISHRSPPPPLSPQCILPSEPQRALNSGISNGQKAIQLAERDLETRAEIPSLGTDLASRKWRQRTLDTNKQNVRSQVAATNAATAQLATLTGVDEVDENAVGAAISTIVSNLPEMMKGVKIIAALTDDERQGEGFIEAARKLCAAFSDLLRAAEPEAKESRQNLLGAVSRVGEASEKLISTVQEKDGDSENQEMLFGLAKAVANATGALVLKAKAVASAAEDQDLRNRIIAAASQCAVATSQLVACSKVVASTIDDKACQDQLIEAAKRNVKAADGVIALCQDVTGVDETLLLDLRATATEVTRVFNDHLNQIKIGSGNQPKKPLGDGGIDRILAASDRLIASAGDSSEMVNQTRILTQAMTQLILAIKGEAHLLTDSDTKTHLLTAAKILADATAHLLECAKAYASDPDDIEFQKALKQAAEDVRSAAIVSTSDEQKEKLMKGLENAAKHAAAAGTQCISAVQASGPHNTNQASQVEMMQDCREVADHISKLVQVVKESTIRRDDANVQLNLIDASQQFLLLGDKLIASTKSVLPTVQDQAIHMQLSNSSKKLGSTLSDLRSTVTRAEEVCGSLEQDAALALIRGLHLELEEFHKAVQTGQLKPLPGETVESTALRLGTSSKSVGSAVTGLLTAASQADEHYTGKAARDAAHSLQDLADAVRGVAATSCDRLVQDQMIQETLKIMHQSIELIGEAHNARKDTNIPDKQKRLNDLARSISQSLSKCVNCLPGQKDVDEAIQVVSSASLGLDTSRLPPTEKSFSELRSEASGMASRLNDVSTEMVQAAKSPLQLAQTSKSFSTAFTDLMNTGLEMSSLTVDEILQREMVISLRSVSTCSSSLLHAAKTLSADPYAPNAKNALLNAARALTESINALLDLYTSAAPGQKECDNAIRSIQSIRPILDNPIEPINDTSYFECLDTLVEKSKSLGVGMANIENSAKKSEFVELNSSVSSISSSICCLIETAAQAAYLVGVSDPSSTEARPGIIDQNAIVSSAKAIHSVCQPIVSENATQYGIMESATVIAKHTGILSNACRMASTKTANQVARLQFLQSATDVTNATAALVQDITAFDDDNGKANRLKCVEATRPLLEAVDNLIAFASSPEFVSTPARISPDARTSQEPIIDAGKSIISDSTSVIQAAKQLAMDPKDPTTLQALADHSKSVTDSIRKLVSTIQEKAPGLRECDSGIETLKSCIQELDQASLSVVSQNPIPRKENSLQGFTEQMIGAAREILNRVEPVRQSAKGEAETLGHRVTQLVSYFGPLASNAVGATNSLHSKQQTDLLDRTKTVCESALQLISAAKKGAGNSKMTHEHDEIDENVENMKEAVSDLMETLEGMAAAAGMVTSFIDQITTAMQQIDDRALGEFQDDLSFVDYQTQLVELVKQIARTAQDMMGKSISDVSEMATVAAGLARVYVALLLETKGALLSTSNPELASRIRSFVLELGQACIQLIKTGGNLQGSPDDSFAQQDLSESVRRVSETVSQVLAALQAGSRGTQACIDAASKVSRIIGDLDTTAMFAEAETLNPEDENDAFINYRDSILKTARALIEETKTLVTGATSSQEKLAVTAQNVVATMSQLADAVKLGAASHTSSNSEAQVLLIKAVRYVASALRDLIQSTKSAAGKNVQDPAMVNLKESARIMVNSVTSLLKTMKSVEEEHNRGTRALESTIEVIAQEIRALRSSDPPRKRANPEDLVRATKPITLATAKAVAAGNSCNQDDVILAANMGRRTISDMLAICKGAAWEAESIEIREKVLTAGQKCASEYQELLQRVIQILTKPTAESKQALLPVSRNLATHVTELVSVAQLLKSSDWEDPDDPIVIAENELLGAANSIDAAAKKLASLRPRRVQEANESLNFDEMILEAAKSIAAASSALIKAASSAQRELIEQGKINGRPNYTSEDGQWSEGLISAAKMVAAATHSLCEAANALVQGHSTEEKLTSAAKQVASSTAQLLVACKVRADSDSPAMKRLQAAGNAVKKATDNLVKAAQQAITREEERNLYFNTRMVEKIAQEIQARSEMLRLEKELEGARTRLAMIRKATYHGQEDEGGVSDRKEYEACDRSESFDKSPMPEESQKPLDQTLSSIGERSGQSSPLQASAGDRDGSPTSPASPRSPKGSENPEGPASPRSPENSESPASLPFPDESLSKSHSATGIFTASNHPWFDTTSHPLTPHEIDQQQQLLDHQQPPQPNEPSIIDSPMLSVSASRSLFEQSSRATITVSSRTIERTYRVAKSTSSTTSQVKHT